MYERAERSGNHSHVSRGRTSSGRHADFIPFQAQPLGGATSWTASERRPIQRKAAEENDEEEAPSSPSSTGVTVAPNTTDEEAPSSADTTEAPNTTGMPDQMKDNLEELSGMDMDDVQVKYNSSEPAQIGALAYTQGTEIHLGPGQEHHLGHEAWHVVQQKQGRVAPNRKFGATVPGNDEPSLEAEAEAMAKKL